MAYDAFCLPRSSLPVFALSATSRKKAPKKSALGVVTMHSAASGEGESALVARFVSSYAVRVEPFPSQSEMQRKIAWRTFFHGSAPSIFIRSALHADSAMSFTVRPTVGTFAM